MKTYIYNIYLYIYNISPLLVSAIENVCVLSYLRGEAEERVDNMKNNRARLSVNIPVN
jgi:hypothetical protein